MRLNDLLAGPIQHSSCEEHSYIRESEISTSQVIKSTTATGEAQNPLAFDPLEAPGFFLVSVTEKGLMIISLIYPTQDLAWSCVYKSTPIRRQTHNCIHHHIQSSGSLSLGPHRSVRIPTTTSSFAYPSTSHS
ncbi:hypothetical protein O181_075606 [Austropuccinia psidii MF-1]|uniref:Uncharacterized protein n=1 Tax=Austropuccinia psidii MF-1 TaxID=1389203 RepID=A0A9Q3F8U9_9BASI|nr:hypothetical protein [Austropuccinia psidii MF-1]